MAGEAVGRRAVRARVGPHRAMGLVGLARVAGGGIAGGAGLAVSRSGLGTAGPSRAITRGTWPGRGRDPSGRSAPVTAGARAGQSTFSRTSAPSVNAPGSSGSQTVMIR
ncbi:hypothetical protein GCM10027074_19560 [Streptomyces deserti]